MALLYFTLPFPRIKNTVKQRPFEKLIVSELVNKCWI
jgi:hypothetical protein